MPTKKNGGMFAAKDTNKALKLQKSMAVIPVSVYLLMAFLLKIPTTDDEWENAYSQSIF